jgi:hypothetical protein
MDIFIHNLFDYGGLAGIVQSTIPVIHQHDKFISWMASYSIKILISLSFSLAFRKIDSILNQTFLFLTRLA